jgi:hypothetical protein
MKTVITRKINGLEIVTGFSELSIEPIETRKIVADEIKKTAEYLAAAEKQNKMSAAYRAAGAAAIKSKATKAQGDKIKHHNEFTMFNAQAKGYENEVKELLPALKKKETELRRTHAVYFEPTARETIKTEAEISNLTDIIASLKGKGYVDLSGNVIEDNRGVVYCKKLSTQWKISRILTLGVKVPKTGILYDDLTAEDKKAVDLQIEIDAAAKLTTAEKLAGKVQAENRAVNDALAMRQKLEIQSVETALEDSRAWFAERMAEVNLIFG